ncbi:helix-turn-helix transcriptional regulator [Bradyrhizobium erythrophlei]|uniref:helix-turn-helix transcriptional regulator n=1 Tax=Bradyrhizobium erythrophlei TaxID=1437360 RepID=UPI0035E9956A
MVQPVPCDGIDPGGYLLEQRLLMVASILCEPGRSHLPIATIAYDCGFSDLSHFGRVFRRRFDRTPGEWRRQQGRRR